MPRAKQTGAAGQIICPACQSKISADGKTLHSRSEFLSDLVDGEEDFKKAETAIEKLEAELKTAKEKIKQLESRPEPQPAQPAPKGAESGSKPKRYLW